MRYFIAPTLEFLQNHVNMVQALLTANHSHVEMYGLMSIGVDYAPSRKARRALVWTAQHPMFTRTAEVALIGSWKTVDVHERLSTIQLQLKFEQVSRTIRPQQKFASQYDHSIGGKPTNDLSYRAISHNAGIALYNFITTGMAPPAIYFEQPPPFASVY